MRRGDSNDCKIRFKNRLTSNGLIKYFKRFLFLCSCFWEETKMFLSLKLVCLIIKFQNWMHFNYFVYVNYISNIVSYLDKNISICLMIYSVNIYRKSLRSQTYRKSGKNKHAFLLNIYSFMRK